MIYGPANRLSTLLAEVFPAEDDAEMAARLVKPPVPQGEIDAHVRAALALTALRVEPQQLLGYKLVFPKGREMVRHELERTHVYTLATGDDVLRATGRHLDAMTKHGAGRIWFLDAPVHYVTDCSDTEVRVLATPTCGLYVLRSLYGHEAQAVPA